jgi:hypothetical protein
MKTTAATARSDAAITYHSEFGQVGRNTVCPEMLGEAA